MSTKVTSDVSDVKCASLRGRGLLSRGVCNFPSHINGVVLSSNSTKPTELKVSDDFDSILEWEHEWDEDRLLNPIEEGLCNIVSKSNVEKSLALFQVLGSVRII